MTDDQAESGRFGARSLGDDVHAMAGPFRQVHSRDLGPKLPMT